MRAAKALAARLVRRPTWDAFFILRRRRLTLPRRSSGTSTSPARRGRQTGRVSASSARAPSSGNLRHTLRSRTTGWPRLPSQLAATTSPAPSRQSGDDPVDRLRREHRAVGQDDRRRLRGRRQCSQPAAQRGAGAELPVGAAHDPRIGVHLVGSDNNVRSRRSSALPANTLRARARAGVTLLRRTETRRGSRRQDDRRDHGAHCSHPRHRHVRIFRATLAAAGGGRVRLGSRVNI